MLPLVPREKISHLMSHQQGKIHHFASWGFEDFQILATGLKAKRDGMRWPETPCLVGGCRHFFIFYPDNWGRWTHFKHIFFRWGGSTTNQLWNFLPLMCFFHLFYQKSGINLQAWSWVCFVVIQRSWGGGVDIEADCVGEIEQRPWQVSFFCSQKKIPLLRDGKLVNNSDQNAHQKCNKHRSTRPD